MATARKNYVVNSATGLNVRQHPAKNAQILRVLSDGEKVAVDNSVEVPGGWKALMGGGFVMAEFLK